MSLPKLLAALAIAASALAASQAACARALVIYYSSLGPAKNADAHPSQDMGHTQFVAYVIKDEVEANIYRLETASPYQAGSLAELRAIARHEHNDNARPEIKNPLPDLSSYNTVYIGNPVWWHDYPMVFYTMFETSDFSGKTLVSFNTNEGSGPSTMVKILRKAAPGATVLPECLAITGTTAAQSADEIRAWLRDRKLSQKQDQ